MKRILVVLLSVVLPVISFASEVNLKIPDLRTKSYFEAFGTNGWNLLAIGIVIIFIGMLFGLWQYIKIKGLPAHKSMLDVSNTIYETCKTYLFQQGKFLMILFLIIGAAMFYYFFGLTGLELPKVLLILFWSVVGIGGSYSVAWFGIRINTLANSRTAFAFLQGKTNRCCSYPFTVRNEHRASACLC